MHVVPYKMNSAVQKNLRSLTVLALALLLALDLTVMHAYPAGYWATGSVLANGKWVKLRVDTTGMQQIAHSELRAMGFPEPEKVTVWGYSGAMLNDDRFRPDIPDDLPQTPATHISGKLIFFGENHIHIGMDRHGRPMHSINPYTTAGYYFLTDSRPAKEPAATAASTQPKPAAECHTEVLLAEPELVNWAKSGSSWFDTPLTTDNHHTINTFILHGRTDNSDVHITYCWVKESGAPQTIRLNTSPSSAMQGTTESTLPRSSRISWQTDSATMTAPRLPDNSIAVSLTLAEPKNDVTTALDWIRLSYTADNTLGGRPQAIMYLHEADALKAALPKGVEIWDVTLPGNAARCSAAGDNIYTVADPAVRQHILVAFDPAASLHNPVVLGDVTPQNLHSMADADMIVITAPELRSQAEELAELHRSIQHMDVIVVTTAEVANEYGSGSESAYAIRRAIKHMHDRDNSKPTYVLLYGTGSYDNRTALGLGVPTYQCHNRLYMTHDQLSFSTDAYYAMLDDAFSADIAHKIKPVVAVGRIPAATPDEAALYNAKAKAFMLDTDGASYHQTALISCDLGDNGEHSAIAENHAAQLERRLPQAVVHKVYSDMYPANREKNDVPLARQTLLSLLDNGVGLFNYVGHGSPHNLVSKAGGVWLDISHVARMRNRHPFLALLSTCYANSFDQTDNAIGTEMLLSRNGAIVVIGNTRSAVSSYNNAFNNLFIGEYASLQPGDTYGQLWLRAMRATLNNYSISNNGSINTVKFILLGDPALPVPIPDYQATLQLSADSIGPQEKFTVTGKITDSEDNTFPFNGTATIDVYADSITIYMLGRQEKEFAGQEVNLNNRLLYRGAAKVTDGRFRLDMRLPATAFTGTTSKARVIAHAIADAPSGSAERRTTAAAAAVALVLTESAPDETTFIPAMITDFRVDGFGDVIPQQTIGPIPTLTATIDGGETGLNMSATTLTPACALHVDNHRAAGAVFTPCPNGQWTVSYTPAPLADGRHTATLTVTDNSGQTDSRTISFIVCHTGPEITLQTATPVARDEIEFTIETGSFEPSYMRLTINDADGSTVHSQEIQPGEPTAVWNLQLADGNPAPPGRYSAAIVATDNRLYSSSPPLRFVVLQ